MVKSIIYASPGMDPIACAKHCAMKLHGLCRGETGIISQFVLFTFAVPAAAVAAAGAQQGSCFEVLPGGQYAVAVLGEGSSHCQWWLILHCMAKG